MDGQLSEEIKMERNQVLLGVLDEIAAARTRELVGTEEEILVEGESRTSNARFQGRTRTNRLVLVEANERWRGELLPVRLTESTGFTLLRGAVVAGGLLGRRRELLLAEIRGDQLRIEDDVGVGLGGR